MKQTKRWLYVLAWLAAAPLLAAGPGPGPRPQTLGFIEERLDLDDKQRELFAALKTSRREHREQWQRAHGELRELVQAESLDRTAVADLAARMADAVESQIVDGAQLMHDFNRSLTPAQREQLAVFEDWREHRGGPGGRPGWLPPEVPEAD